MTMTTSAASEWPDLTLFPGVADAVEEARQAVAELRRHPVNRRGWATSAAAAAVRASRASAALDGGSPELNAAAETVTDPVLAGALRCNSAMATLAPIWERAPLQALARLHTLAAADIEEPGALGRPRAAGGELGARLLGVAAIRVTAPWSAPVKVAVVHAEVLSLHPFGSANGVVARAAGRLTAICSGMDQQSLTVPEVHYLRTQNEYRHLLAEYSTGQETAVAAWIIYTCRALVAGAREGKSIADAAATAG